MLEVSLRTGLNTICHKAVQSTQVTTAAIMSAMLSSVCETRHSAAISGVWSSVSVMPASSGDDPSDNSMIVPGSARSAPKARPMLSKNVSLSRLTIWAGAIGSPGTVSTRLPKGVEIAIDLTPTLASSLRASSGGISVAPSASKALTTVSADASLL